MTMTMTMVMTMTMLSVSGKWSVPSASHITCFPQTTLFSLAQYTSDNGHQDHGGYQISPFWESFCLLSFAIICYNLILFDIICYYLLFVISGWDQSYPPFELGELLFVIICCFYFICYLLLGICYLLLVICHLLFFVISGWDQSYPPFSWESFFSYLLLFNIIWYYLLWFVICHLLLVVINGWDHSYPPF